MVTRLRGLRVKETFGRTDGRGSVDGLPSKDERIVDM